MCMSEATISPCGLYRYDLHRRWGDGYLMPFVMLNPSTADAMVDDPTIRRCIGFARREGVGGIVVANIFAFRATKPEDMKRADDPFGPDNDQTLERIARASVVDDMPIVCAWGSHGGLRGAHDRALRILQSVGARLVCLGRTASGMPKHPLYISGSQPLVPFP